MGETQIDSSGENEAGHKPRTSPAEGFSADEGEIFAAHWHLFVPTIIIAVSYLTGIVILYLTGKADGALARLFLIVVAVGVPLLTAHACLRYFTSRVQIGDDHIRYHPGWPKRLPVDIPFALIKKSVVKRGLSGRLFGGGTLVIELTTDQKISVPDLREPEAAHRKLQDAL